MSARAIVAELLRWVASRLDPIVPVDIDRDTDKAEQTAEGIKTMGCFIQIGNALHGACKAPQIEC